MLVEDFIQLINSCEDGTIEDIKKIYNYIEKQVDEDTRKKIIEKLKKCAFNPLAIDVFLTGNESVEQQIFLIDNILDFNHPMEEKEVFLKKLIQEKNMMIDDKILFLRILSTNKTFPIAMKLYQKGHFNVNYNPNKRDKHLLFRSFSEKIKLYQDVKEIYTGEKELEINALYTDISSNVVATLFENAIRTYSSLDEEKVIKLDSFLCNDNIRNYRNQEELLLMGYSYIAYNFDTNIYEIFSKEELLKRPFQEQKQIIALYEQTHCHDKFCTVLRKTDSYLETLSMENYINLFQEVIHSGFKEKTVDLFISNALYIANCSKDFAPSQYERVLSLLKDSYDGKDRFDIQMDQLKYKYQLIDYLSQIKEEDGNCDLKPNTMVKKFNEVKVQRED